MSFLDKFLNVMRLNPDDDDDFYNEDYDYDDEEEEVKPKSSRICPSRFITMQRRNVLHPDQPSKWCLPLPVLPLV